MQTLHADRVAVLARRVAPAVRAARRPKWCIAVAAARPVAVRRAVGSGTVRPAAPTAAARPVAVRHDVGSEFDTRTVAARRVGAAAAAAAGDSTCAIRRPGSRLPGTRV